MKVNEVVKELRALSNEELEAKIKEAKKESAYNMLDALELIE